MISQKGTFPKILQNFCGKNGENCPVVSNSAEIFQYISSKFSFLQIFLKNFEFFENSRKLSAFFGGNPLSIFLGKFLFFLAKNSLRCHPKVSMRRYISQWRHRTRRGYQGQKYS